MLGAILGDIIGSRFEKRTPPVSKAFNLFHDDCVFTDDTVLSVAVADCILNGKSYEAAIREYFLKYPYAGYGGAFKLWANNPIGVAYDSFGNGSAMRVAPIGWAFDTEESVMEEAAKTAICSHNHPEGIKGAQAVALAVFLARNGTDKQEIKNRIREMGYPQIDLVDGSHTGFDVTCQGTVPQAVWSFVESDSVEDAIRRAIMIGGDADTLACIAGAIAHAYYKDLPQDFVDEIFVRLTPDLASITKDFVHKYVDDKIVMDAAQSEDYMKKDLFRSIFT